MLRGSSELQLLELRSQNLHGLGDALVLLSGGVSRARAFGALLGIGGRERLATARTVRVELEADRRRLTEMLFGRAGKRRHALLVTGYQHAVRWPADDHAVRHQA